MDAPTVKDFDALNAKLGDLLNAIERLKTSLKFIKLEQTLMDIWGKDWSGYYDCD